MKVAIASDDGLNISQHFGRAPFYIAYTIENDKITAKEVRDKVGHHSFIQDHAEGAEGCGGHSAGGEHGTDAASQNKHHSMIDAARDCQFIITGHMGGGAFHSILEADIEPLLACGQSTELLVSYTGKCASFACKSCGSADLEKQQSIPVVLNRCNPGGKTCCGAEDRSQVSSCGGGGGGGCCCGH